MFSGCVAPDLAETEPYVLLIHTGANHPHLEQTSKWDDGSMTIIVNPGSDTPSRAVVVTEKFPVSREDHVRTDCWLSESVGKHYKGVWLSESVGEPKLIKVDVSSHYFELDKDALYIREITIIYRSTCYRFPCNNYIYPHNPLRGNPTAARLGCPPHVFSRAGSGTLRSKETEEYILNAREEDLLTTRAMVPWSKGNGKRVPRHVNYVQYAQLPRFLKFKEAELDSFYVMREGTKKALLQTILNTKVRTFLGINELKHLPSLAAYNDFIMSTGTARGFEKDQIRTAMNMEKRWKEDTEFGRQMLIGPNPMSIHLCTGVGDRWKEAPTLPGHLFNGQTLEEVIAHNKIYEINTEDLGGIPDGGALNELLCGVPHKWYTTMADCLFFVDSEEKLTPFIIRLEYANGGEAPTFWCPPAPGTPEADPSYLAWMLAKMYFRCADGNVYALSIHFGRGHAVNEAFACSMFRNLPRAHPIHKLLYHHLAGIIPVNVQARLVLTNSGKPIFSLFMSSGDHLDSVLENYFGKRMTYQSLLIPKEFESRGISDIPNFYFRDDALLLWDAMHEYVSELMNLTYSTDEEVVKDEELTDFTTEIVDIGMAELGGAGFPRQLTTIPDLADLLTMIIFNVSVFHAAVNFQTLNYAGYIPNMPLALFQPPPKQDEVITMERILKTLPVEEIAFTQINTSYNLGQFSPTEKFFIETQYEKKAGMLGESMLVGRNEMECTERFINCMKGIRDIISERNSKLEQPYDTISPQNIPIATQV